MYNWLKYIQQKYTDSMFKNSLENYCSSDQFEADINELNGDWKQAINIYYKEIIKGKSNGHNMWCLR